MPKIVSDLKYAFDEFFASQYTPFENKSKLSPSFMKTDGLSSTTSLKKGDINLIIKPLNQTKTHAFDNTSVFVIQ